MSKSRVFLLPLILLLSACGEMPKMPKLDTSSFDVSDRFSIYRLDIRQGNFITQDMVSQLKPGLTREQVRYVLGTPLVADPFHGNRWDYVYRYNDGKGETQQRNFSVYFDDNKLVRVSGDVAAADPNAVDPKTTATAEVLKQGETAPAPAKNDADKAVNAPAAAQ